MPKRQRKDLQGSAYAARRRAFLEAWDGPCWWCKRAVANEVDHVVPVGARAAVPRLLRGDADFGHESFS